MQTLAIASSWVVSLRLLEVWAPQPLVIIFQGWPSSLIYMLALNITLAGSFSPPVYHCHFNVPIKSIVTAWKSSLPLPHACLKGDYTFIISGSVTFVKRMCTKLPDTGKVIACFEVDFEKSTGNRRCL